MTDDPPITIYVEKITFKIKTGYYLELLMFETMELLGSSQNKTTKNKNGPHLEITEYLKYNIRKYTIRFSKNLAKNTNKKIADLETNLKHFEKHYEN